MGRGLYRTMHQCNRKFREKQNGYQIQRHLQQLLTQQKRWESDQQIFERTLKLYFVDTKKYFKFIDVSIFLYVSLRWVKEYKEEEEGGHERTKVSETSYNTSSDAYFGVDLNVVDELEIEGVV